MRYSLDTHFSCHSTSSGECLNAPFCYCHRLHTYRHAYVIRVHLVILAYKNFDEHKKNILFSCKCTHTLCDYL